MVSNIKTLVDTLFKKKKIKNIHKNQKTGKGMAKNGKWNGTSLEVEWQRILPQNFSPNLWVVLGRAVNAENMRKKPIVMSYSGNGVI